MIIVHIILCLSYTIGCEASDSGSHSLLIFATYIKGKTPFEQFSAVLMLDDIQVGYFSSKEPELVLRGMMNAENTPDPTDEKNAITVFTAIHEHMRIQAHNLMHNFNHTDGIQIHQEISGCDTLGSVIHKEAFNAECGDEFLFNIQQNTLHTDFKWPGAWDAVLLKHNKWLIASFYQPLCVSVLKKYMSNNSKRIMKKMKPRVRLLQNALTHSGGAQLTCLATGFYPRHINLTLLRDGQPVADHLITGGEVLPNGDETYQMRKRMVISAEELREKHHYTCTVTHLSLDNKLDIDLTFAPGPAATVSTVVVVAGILFLAGFIMMKKRHAGV
ncbi:major histocompatibility complex class I-related gene protein-like [Electrophorus electricus]|uniref:major histocompatibility complex class I-related gene protein-like n=1 Tax=Electrophorus electricus TaxID=8005 RepID=UPI0015D04F16|nr:major histocompatibility complex class I-related gene protein-like [Electrophorus electricus]